jgi:hypothetical protein
MNTARHLLRFTDPAQLTHRWGLARWASLPLRLITGYGFVEHGYAKILKNPDTFAGILHTLGVPAPHFTAWATILTELVGGLAVLVGAFVPLVSLPMISGADGGDIDCASSVRVLVDQAAGRHISRCAVRPTRLRDGSALSRVSGRAGAGRIGTARRRWLACPSRAEIGEGDGERGANGAYIPTPGLKTAGTDAR